MKKLLTLTAALATSTMAMAFDTGRVVSAIPVMERVAMPRQVCTVERVQVERGRSGAGAAIGGVAGGVLGNSVAHGRDKGVATLVGAVGGAILGNQFEQRAPGRVEYVQHCTTQTFFENRPVAHDVVRDHAGRRHSVRTNADPGATIIVRAGPGAIAVPPRGGAYRAWDTPQAPVWSGHRRQPAVRYISTERRGNTWEDDFLDRQMR